jgi:hypothetical protein
LVKIIVANYLKSSHFLRDFNHYRFLYSIYIVNEPIMVLLVPARWVYFCKKIKLPSTLPEFIVFV